MRDRLSPRAQLRQFRDHLPALVEVAQALPPLMKVAVQRLQDGTLHIGAQPEDIERLREEIRASERRRSKTAIASMLGLGGLLWLGLGLDPPWLTTVLIIASAVFYWRSRRH
jgi:ferric-dicitrate binding protein FerR (iron transport regulator)